VSFIFRFAGEFVEMQQPKRCVLYVLSVFVLTFHGKTYACDLDGEDQQDSAYLQQALYVTRVTVAIGNTFVLSVLSPVHTIKLPQTICKFPSNWRQLVR